MNFLRSCALDGSFFTWSKILRMISSSLYSLSDMTRVSGISSLMALTCIRALFPSSRMRFTSSSMSSVTLTAGSPRSWALASLWILLFSAALYCSYARLVSISVVLFLSILAPGRIFFLIICSRFFTSSLVDVPTLSASFSMLKYSALPTADPYS